MEINIEITLKDKVLEPEPFTSIGSAIQYLVGLQRLLPKVDDND